MHKILVYRPEIDGLRAIAVISVVLYHSNINILPRGFLGVDIFFVISGFLITGILNRDLTNGTFSIATFYERRVRRILPGLLFVTLAIIPFAWVWLMPSDLKDFSQSLIAILLFSSNLLFFKESGYFEVSAELKPLMHTWSLSVEEQFYLFFPFLFLLLFRKSQRFLLLLTISASAVGFGVSLLLGESNQDFVFYMIFTRAWELLFGSFCFFCREELIKAKIFSAPKFYFLRVLLSCIGLLLIAKSLIGDMDWITFPEVALFSVIGAGLVLIFLDGKYDIGKLLSSFPFVILGLSSYSIYLWHQPIFALANQRTLSELKIEQTVFLLLLILILGVITWKFVERPFRERSIVGTRLLLTCVSVSYSMIFLIGMVGQITDGRASPNGDRWNQVNERVYAPNYGLGQECDSYIKNQFDCSTSTEPEILIWGDSFAMHLVDGIVASKPEIGIIQETTSNCAPILGIAVSSPGTSSNSILDCIESNDRIIASLAAQESIKFVVLSSSFRAFYEENNKPIDRNLSTLNSDEEITNGMIKTIRLIRALGKRTIIFSPTPMTGTDFGRCTKKAAFFGRSLEECDFQLKQSEIYQKEEMTLLSRLKSETEIVWLSNGICNVNSICRVSENKTILYRDSGHLTVEGSKLLGRKMDFYSLIANAN